MTTTDYRPVSCGLHSEYELLAMRRAWVWLDLALPEGPLDGVKCRLLEVRTRDGAEFLEGVTVDGEPFAYRLDQVRAVRTGDGRQISGCG